MQIFGSAHPRRQPNRLQKKGHPLIINRFALGHLRQGQGKTN